MGDKGGEVGEGLVEIINGGGGTWNGFCGRKEGEQWSFDHLFDPGLIFEGRWAFGLGLVNQRLVWGGFAWFLISKGPIWLVNKYKDHSCRF